MKPHLNKYWCILPKENATFVAAMADILDIYQHPYNPEVPIICMDEKSCQLLGEWLSPLPMKPGSTKKTDCEYVRNDTCSIFIFIEPLAGICCVEALEHQTKVDFTHHQEKVILVSDNLNTHNISFFYEAFDPETARQ